MFTKAGKVNTSHQNPWYSGWLRWNPHCHAIVLESGFDDQGTFFYIPFCGLQSMVEVFRRRVMKLLVARELLNEDFAQSLLSRKHSGFSIDNSVRILDESSQASLSEYIARPPISLGKIRYEPFKGRVLFHTTYSEYFKQNLHMFDALDFLAQLTQHIPPKCGAEMEMIAIIEDPDEIKRILRSLVKIGRSPPELTPIVSTDRFLCNAPRETYVCLPAQTNRKPHRYVLLTRLSAQMDANGPVISLRTSAVAAFLTLHARFRFTLQDSFSLCFRVKSR